MVIERDQYTDKSIQFRAGDIYEYDIETAGLAISRELKLLSPEKIDELSKMPKDQRNIAIGKLQRADKEFRDNLKEGFKYFRKMFAEANDLRDEDIISVKKDAIFTKVYCSNRYFKAKSWYTEDDIDPEETYLVFKEKNEYSSFMMLGRLEIYRNENRIDIKGIDDSIVEKSSDGILKVIDRTMELMEEYDYDGAIRYLCRTIEDYKNLGLPIACYRELDSGKYRVTLPATTDNIRCSSESYVDQEIVMDDIGEDYKLHVVPHYNFMHVLVPLLNILI